MNPADSQLPVTPGAGDGFRTQYWDTLALATGVNKYTMFQTPQSSAKTYGETNLKYAGQFPAGVNFYGERLGFKFIPPEATVAAEADLDALNALYSWAGQVSVILTLADKEIGRWHLTNWLNTINLAMEAAASTAAAQTAATTAPAWYTLGSLASGTSIPFISTWPFSIVVENHDGTNATPAALNGYKIITILDGQEQRMK